MVGQIKKSQFICYVHAFKFFIETTDKSVVKANTCNSNVHQYIDDS